MSSRMPLSDPATMERISLALITGKTLKMGVVCISIVDDVLRFDCRDCDSVISVPFTVSHVAVEYGRIMAFCTDHAHQAKEPSNA